MSSAQKDPAFSVGDIVEITVPFEIRRTVTAGGLECDCVTSVPAGATARIGKVTPDGYVMHSYCRVGNTLFQETDLRPSNGLGGRAPGEYILDDDGTVLDVDV